MSQTGVKRDADIAIQRSGIDAIEGWWRSGRDERIKGGRGANAENVANLVNGDGEKVQLAGGGFVQAEMPIGIGVKADRSRPGFEIRDWPV